MKNIMYREAPIPSYPRNAFDLSYEYKTSMKLGELIPFLWYDVGPGDAFQIKSEVLVKFAPMLAPLLHRVDVYAHYFFVPYRLLMNQGPAGYGGWTDFITGDPEGWTTTLELPYVTISNANKSYFSEGSLADYLGLPVIDSGTTVTQDIDINVLPFLAYHLIYDDYYRDENLIAKRTSTMVGVADIDLVGKDSNGDISYICTTTPLRRAYEKDYFRGALPTAYYDLGGEDVEMDLDIWGNGNGGSPIKMVDNAGATPAAGSPQFSGASPTLYDSSGTAASDQLHFMAVQQPATAILELMELRRAEGLLRYLEAQNRGGDRYPEVLLGVYGVIPDNSELQYPKYIGGGKQAVQISSVLNQSQALDPTAGVNDGAGGVTVTVDPQSFETGRGMAVGNKNFASHYAKEHGIIMGIMSVLPRTAYGGAQIEKFWRKADRTDFFVPQLQHIGDQEILQSEIGYDATGTDADNVFGYVPRWSEYKSKYSIVTGSFLSTLDYWHMATIGDTSGAGPDLNQAFIECQAADDEIIRPFADQTGTDTLYVEVYHDVKAVRPMLVHDIPGNTQH
jgi:hypothetical protein